MLHTLDHQEVALAEPFTLSVASLTRTPLPGNVDHIGHFFLGRYHGDRLVDEPLPCRERTAILMDGNRAMNFKEIIEKAERSGLVLLPRTALVSLAAANPEIEDAGPIYALGDSVTVRIPDSAFTPDQKRNRQMVYLLTRFEGVRSIISHDVRHDFPPGSRFLAIKTRS
jgi:hypothetical protein